MLLLLVGCGGEERDLRAQPQKARSGRAPQACGSTARPAKPKDVVIFLHGQGGPDEAKPDNHLPWINHLVSRGSIVVYPRYEMDYEADAMPFLVDGLETAERRSISTACRSS